jgi:hypothetical protein
MFYVNVPFGILSVLGIRLFLGRRGVDRQHRRGGGLEPDPEDRIRPHCTGKSPSDYAIFQGAGIIFTVIIAREFKKLLLVIAERRETWCRSAR